MAKGWQQVRQLKDFVAARDPDGGDTERGPATQQLPPDYDVGDGSSTDTSQGDPASSSGGNEVSLWPSDSRDVWMLPRGAEQFPVDYVITQLY